MIAVYRAMNRVYIAQSTGIHKFENLSLAAVTMPSNRFYWKMPGQANTIMVSESRMREVDLLRDEKLFHGPLNMDSVLKQIVPNMKKILKKYGRIDKDNETLTSFYVAKEDLVVRIEMNGDIVWIDSVDVSEGIDFLKSSLDRYADKKPFDKLHFALRDLMIHFGSLPYPMMITDTKTMRTTVIEDSTT
jgi:hypothetical protein